MTHESSDADVLARSVDEPEAFGLIYERHVDPVLRYMRRRLGDAAAEDATVEVFARAFSERARYTPRHPTAIPWLYWLAGLVIADQARAERRRLRLLTRLTQHATETATDDVLLADVAPALVKALRKLSPELRETLLLVVWGELSYEEAAAALDVPIGTVRSRVARARARLRAELPASTLDTSLAPHLGEAHA